MSKPVIATKVNVLRDLLNERGGDALFVTHRPDIRWAVGFTGSNALLVVTPDVAHFVTDGRYTTQAADEVVGATVHVPGYALAKHVAEASLLGEARSVVVQSEHVTLAERDRWGELFPDVDFRPVENLLVEAVAAKDDTAIDAVRRAQALTCRIFEGLLPEIRPGMTERELAAEIVVRHLRGGASAIAFEPIVAAGARGALPHARPSDAPFKRGDMIVIDMGGVVDGYCADLTRTVALGEPGDEARAAYAAVRDAQRAGLDALHAGVSGADVDRAARSVLEAAGLGAYFTHSLGHGVGLDVHEWPRLSQQVDHRIPAGATVTVEPGVYLPGRFGVRIEDLVAVSAEGHENLTPVDTELVVLS